ncbi:hypothetical protein C8R47DRAFT_1082975, partial [Mycena vitilis]
QYGFATDFEKRRRAYARCEEGDWTHLWFWVFYTEYRVVAERINHLLFLDDGAPRVRRQCDGCLVEHREFWRYADVGDFDRLLTQGELVLAALGDVNAERLSIQCERPHAGEIVFWGPLTFIFLQMRNVASECVQSGRFIQIFTSRPDLGYTALNAETRFDSSRGRADGICTHWDFKVLRVNLNRDIPNWDARSSRPKRENCLVRTRAECIIWEVVLSGLGELPLWGLSAVNRNELRVDSGPRVLEQELDEYMSLLQTKYNEGTDLDRVHAPYFPDWFWTDNETSTISQTAPELPDIPFLDLAIMAEIIQDLSDDEDIAKLLADYDSPATEDAQMQQAIFECLKDPKAKCLGAERRAGPSKLKLGAVIVEVAEDGQEIPGSPEHIKRVGPTSGKARYLREEGST